MQIIIPEARSANHGDLSWDPIDRLGTLILYEDTKQAELVDRSRDAQIIIINKLKVGPKEMDQIPKLELICLLATGYDNVDIVSARERGISVCNAVGYGTEAVAQHVLALLLHATNHVALHNNSVQEGMWSRRDWSYTLRPLCELTGKTFGIYGFGKIGQSVARIAAAFGMHILVNTRTPQPSQFPDIEFVDLESLFSRSDIISLHAPLSPDNQGIVNANLLQLLKKDSILINTGRGGLINEADLRAHLLENKECTAALDVLTVEPPSEDHPLIGLSNCIITPHNAWVAREARQRLIDIVADNIRGYLTGEPQNVVNPS